MQSCIKCKSTNVFVWTLGEYVCLDCRYNSLYKEIMSKEDFDEWQNTQ